VSRPEYKKDFPARLKKARLERNLTLKQLAAAVGVSFQTVQRWETGERVPEFIAATNLARVLQDALGEPWLLVHAEPPTIREIPIQAYVAAGRPIDEVIEDQTVAVDPDFIRVAGDVCALRVRGESMLDHHILDNDVLICRKTTEPRNKSVVVVDLRDGMGASVKFWSRRGDTVRLSSNPEAANGEQFSFSAVKLGKVYEIVGLVRSLK
jgi:SOS-response transcriptional repressor LexA